MTDTTETLRPTRRIPEWLIRAIWKTNRAAYRITGGRFGLRTPTDTRWGMLELRAVGRRSGKTRVAILGYIEDSGNLVIPAMNGWMDPEPAWWLNLQANPNATVVLPGGERREVVARAAAVGEEQERLWRRLVALGTAAYTDGNATLRSRETAVAVLER